MASPLLPPLQEEQRQALLSSARFSFVGLDLARSAVMVPWAAAMGLFWTRWFRLMDARFVHMRLVPGVMAKVVTTAVLAAPVTNVLFLSGVTIAEEAVRREERQPRACGLRLLALNLSSGHLFVSRRVASRPPLDWL